MANNGFRNEDKIRLELNNKKLSQINNNLKNVVLAVYGNVVPDTIILCHKWGGVEKADLALEVNGVTKYISVKSGSGNSVHQEGVEDFIKFLAQNYGDNQDVFDAIRHFIWGDGTLDGRGERQNRIRCSVYVKIYPRNIQLIKSYFYAIKPRLIERFVVSGAKSTFRPDYIYYGDYDSGIIIDSDTALRYLSDDLNESASSIPVGKLCFQAWNRALGAETRSESKRGVIQLKWPSLKEDLKRMINE